MIDKRYSWVARTGNEGGALLSIRPGRYRIGHGDHEGTDGRYAPAGPATGPGDWSCRWVRFNHCADI